MIKKVGRDWAMVSKLYSAGVTKVPRGSDGHVVVRGWGRRVLSSSPALSPLPFLPQLKQLYFDLFCFLTLRAVGRFHFLMFIISLGTSEGTFCRTCPGTWLLLSMQRQMPILIALIDSGRRNTLSCLLRASEHAKVLARPGTVPSTYMLLLTVCCGSCWDKP